MQASYDGFNYEVNDASFQWHINNGLSEPYPIYIKVVQKYQRLFPHKNRTYIDVGGHIGTTALPYSRLFNKVYSYEPTKNNYNLLETNVKKNGVTKITCYNKGLYNRECKGDIIRHGSNTGCYYFKPSETGTIECTTLDAANYMDVDYIKIDVEGAELYVLEGAQDTIKRWKPLIQIELNGLSEKHYGISEKTLIDKLESMGYILFERPDPGNYFFYNPNDTLSIQPKIIYQFWTGENDLTPRRLVCLEQFRRTSGCHVRLIKHNEVESLIMGAHPLHSAYPYLSQVHKADYLRTYFMHFYGGGYSDIKQTRGSWNHAFEDIIRRPDAVANGYREGGPNCIGYKPYCSEWSKLIGNGSYIVRPNTPMTKEWYSSMIALLDQKLEALKTHPAKHPRDKAEDNSGYPIEWNEMLGRIFHRVQFPYHTALLYSVPPGDFSNYQ